MSDPIPNFAAQRLHWDFRRGRTFAGGVLQPGSPVANVTCLRPQAASAENYDGTLVAFAPNAVRSTDRGVLLEAASTQLLSNSALIGAVVGEKGNGGQLPIGWNEAPGVVATIEEAGDEGGLPYIVVGITYDNTANAEIATIRLSLEATGALAVPGNRVACFSGQATVLSLTNAFDPQLRMIVRDADDEIDGDDGATTINGLNSPTRYAVVPEISVTGTSLNPAVTVRVNIGQVGGVLIKLRGVQVEAGGNPTSWIRTTPDVYAGPDSYTRYPFTGAVLGRIRVPGKDEGTGGRLPDGLSNSSMDRVEIIGIGTEEAGDVTLRFTIVGNAVGSASERTGVFRLTAAESFAAAAPGDRWQAGIIARVLACPADVKPKLRVGARTAGNVAVRPVLVDGGDIALGTRKAESINTGVLPALTAVVTTGINITVPNGTTAVVEIRLFRPTMRLLARAAVASGPVLREADFLRIPTAASAFALPCTILIDAEHRTTDENQVLLDLSFGARRVQLMLGRNVGVVVQGASDLFGGSEGTLASLLQPANGSQGALKLAVSISATGIAVGYPDGAGYGYASAALPALAPCSGAGFGDQFTAAAYTGFVRAITVLNGTINPANLPGRTRDEWGPRHFRQRVGLSRPPALADVQAFAGNIIDTPGPTYSTFPIDRSARYYRRSNGGAAITSVLPSAAAANAAVAFFRITIINTGSGTNTITAPDGGIVTPTFEGTETSYVQPGNSYTMFVSDGVRWFWYTIAGAPFAPPEQVPCVSIYGPDRPGNENRDQLYGPAVAQFYAVIDNVRSMHAFVIEQMNAYLEAGDLGAAARAARTLVEWCAADYWRGPVTLDQVGLSSLTNLPEAPIAVCYALFGIRFAGVLTTAETKVITDWIERRMVDTRIRFVPLRDECLALQIANNWTISGLQNHSWKWAMANALASIALNRHDYLQDALQLFRIAMDDTAAVPGSVGAFANEIARGDRCVNYEMVALSWLLGASEALIGFGFAPYAYAGGIFVPAIDFAMRACDTPAIVTDEQARMRDLGVTGTQYPITPTTQLGIGFGNVQDDATGQFLFAESRVAAGYLGWRHVTDAQVAWKALWAPRWDVYENAYSSRVGGAQKTLYPLAPATPVVGLRPL